MLGLDNLEEIGTVLSVGSKVPPTRRDVRYYHQKLSQIDGVRQQQQYTISEFWSMVWTENSWKQVCAQQSKSSISGWPRAWIHTVCGCGPSNAIFVFSSLNSVFSQKIDLWGCCFLCAVTGWFIARVSKLPWLWHSSNLFLATTYAKQMSMKGDTFRVKSN